MPGTCSSCHHHLHLLAAAHCSLNTLDFVVNTLDWMKSYWYLLDHMLETLESTLDWTKSCYYFDRMPEILVSTLDWTKSCSYQDHFEHMLDSLESSFHSAVSTLDWTKSCWNYYPDPDCMRGSLASSFHFAASKRGRMT